jgi:hypothetical protein
MRLILFLSFLLMAFLITGCLNSHTSNYSAEDEKRLELVREYADRVLEQGMDRWSGGNTPLLSDGQNVETGEPVDGVMTERNILSPIWPISKTSSGYWPDSVT